MRRPPISEAQWAAVRAMRAALCEYCRSDQGPEAAERLRRDTAGWVFVTAEGEGLRQS